MPNREGAAIRSRLSQHRAICWDRRPTDSRFVEGMERANFHTTPSRRFVRRRDALSLIAGHAAWTTSVHAQKPSMPVIGYLCAESTAMFASRLKAFHKGLAEAGFVEGRNVAIEYRWAEG